MNYKRIYDEFIADRKTKQPSKPDYYEVHHIIPRCMGGDDGPSNLIRLTASDHLFAHQLLARAYNDTQYAHGLWGAVLIICRDFLKQEAEGSETGNKRKGSLTIANGKGLRIRKGLDHARKMRIDTMSGINSPISDKTEYLFRNNDGSEFLGTRIAFSEKHGVSPGIMPRLLKDENCRTKDGWFIPDMTISDDERLKRSDPKIYKLWTAAGATSIGKTVTPGAIYKGNRRSLKQKTGKSWDAIHYLIDKSPSGFDGWKVIE